MAQPTLDAYVDSIFYGTAHWDKDELTYYFDNSYLFWTAAAKDAFRASLKSWSDVADISFRPVYFSGSADLIEYYVNDADMMDVIGDASGAHEVPWGSSRNATLEGWYNRDSFTWARSSGTENASLGSGGFGRAVMIHEIGHALGLAHPHDSDGLTVAMPGVSDPYDLGRNQLNQGVFTVMSYNNGWNRQYPEGSNVNDKGYNSGPGAFDIAAIQYLYGADTSNNVGGTTYNLTDSMGWSSIWDTGGSDKIRYTGNEDTVINLNSAPLDEGKNAGGFLSYVKGNNNYGGYTIAGDATNALANRNGETGVIIENATGGNGKDKITGNMVGNEIKGNGGADDLSGRAGNDQIFGGNGNDYVNAGADDDVVLGGGGNDVLKGGSGDDTLAGGSGGDRLSGLKGADVLNGAGGSDSLRGGVGADKFVFREDYGRDEIRDFKRGVDTLELDEDLWGGGKTVAEVISDYGKDKGDFVRFKFGVGEYIDLIGVQNFAGLEDDISLV